jgi:hypothetical protein
MLCPLNALIIHNKNMKTTPNGVVRISVMQCKIHQLVYSGFCIEAMTTPNGVFRILNLFINYTKRCIQAVAKTIRIHQMVYSEPKWLIHLVKMVSLIGHKRSNFFLFRRRVGSLTLKIHTHHHVCTYTTCRAYGRIQISSKYDEDPSLS